MNHHEERWEANEELAREFAEKAQAIYVMRCTKSEALNSSWNGRVKIKTTQDIEKLSYFIRTFPHNRYVLLTPHAFVDLQAAILGDIEPKELRERERELCIRLNLLNTEVDKIKKSRFLHFVTKIFGVNLDIISDWKRAQLKENYKES